MVEFHCPRGKNLDTDERYPVSLIGAQVNQIREAIRSADPAFVLESV
jgi:hypothetical protein